MTDGMTLAFLPLVQTAALMIVIAGFGLMVWGMIKDRTFYLKLGLACTGISALVALATR